MVTYKQMVEMSNSTRATMNDSLDHIDVFLSELKKTHPKMVEDFFKQEYVIMNGKHFVESYAHKIVDGMSHTDQNDQIIRGALIGVDEASMIICEKKRELLRWDAYVGVNGFLHDLARAGLSRSEIISAAKEFWFNDDDFEEAECKVWWYYSNM